MLYRVAVTVMVLCLARFSLCAAEAPQELREAIQARLTAVWQKDAAAWGRLTTDEFTMVGPEGELMNKAKRLVALKKEKPEPVHEVKHEQLRVYGSTAVHRFIDGSECVLEVWVHEHGKWRVTAAQVNLVKR